MYYVILNGLEMILRMQIKMYLLMQIKHFLYIFAVAFYIVFFQQVAAAVRNTFVLTSYMLIIGKMGKGGFDLAESQTCYGCCL